MSCIAVIPARGGSKRIPRKNIRPFRIGIPGYAPPVILNSINVARDSKLFDDIFVSTEDVEIGGIALDAEVYWSERPASLADGHTTTAQVLERELELRGEGCEYACCIYPCAPFLTTADLIESSGILRKQNCHSVFAMARFEAPIQRAIRWEDGKMRMAFPEHRDTRSQDLPTWYRDAGMFYWVNVKRFLAEPVLWHEDSRAVVIPRERAIDIDTEDDWRRAEQAYRMIHDRAA